MARNALLIGAPTYGLRGVGNDVAAMTTALAARGFHIERCVGKDATRAGILGAYERLIERTTAGDAAVVYFSGRGGLAAATGAEILPTNRRFIVPVDFASSSEHDFRGITRVELSALLARLTERSDNVVTLLDCCYAGLRSRDGGLVTKALPAAVRMDLAAHLRRRMWGGSRVDLSRPLANPGAVRVVACAPEQQAYELRDGYGTPMGVLTRALAAALGEAGRLPVSWSTLIGRVRRQVRDAVAHQRPEVEGPTGRLLFEVTEAGEPASLPVAPDGDGRVRLDGGPLLGVQPGDEFVLVADEGKAVTITLASAREGALDPATSTEPISPADPTSPTSPGIPSGPGRPSIHGRPTGSADSASPTSPTSPASPASPADPASPASPAGPAAVAAVDTAGLATAGAGGRATKRAAELATEDPVGVADPAAAGLSSASGVGGSDAIGWVVVDGGDGTAAFGALTLREGRERLPVGARAVRIKAAGPRLAVRLPPGDPGLAAAVTASSYVYAGEPYALRVVREHEALTVHDSVGPLHAPRPVGNGTIRQVVRDLERVAKARALLRLAEEDGQDPGLRVTLEWGRVVGGHPQPVGNAGAAVRTGDPIYVKVRNDGPGPVFLSLVDVGVSGHISVLNRDRRTGIHLSHLDEYVLGHDRRGRLRGVPLTWPAGLDPTRRRPETVLAIVTTEPLDVTVLEQESGTTGRVAGAPSPLGALLAQVATGATRELVAPGRTAQRYLIRTIEFDLLPPS